MLKFSVITPSFNQGQYIRQTIESVLEQGYPNFEHIVIDGGSTDNTVEVLKSFPHLQWVSEPDNGQTNALNKGFRRATGDIIAWINSDDWYPPGIFADVARELEKHPIVAGECAITDGDGKESYRVPNLQRSWYDLLKHWVPYSIPTQPSIFFRREILDEVRRLDGDYLDEELDYCMDYELWLRVFRRYEFKRIDKLLSYYRMYEANKTGSGMEKLRPEMSRIFRRHELRGLPLEHDYAFVIPTQGLSTELTSTLETIARQIMKDFEVLVVDYAPNGGDSKNLRKSIRDAANSWYALRYVRAKEPTFASALNTGFELSCARYLVYLEPGAVVRPDFLLETNRLFDTDRIGLILPFGNRRDLWKVFLGPDHRLQLEGFFVIPEVPFNLAVRKAALLDLGGFRASSSFLLTLRTFLLRTIYKGWNIWVDQSMSVDFARQCPLPDSVPQSLNDFVNSTLILELDEEYQRESFAKIREEHGCTLRFTPEVVENCRQLLAQATRTEAGVEKGA